MIDCVLSKALTALFLAPVIALVLLALGFPVWVLAQMSPALAVALIGLAVMSGARK